MTKPVSAIPCFICCSNKDRSFAEKLHADLCNNGVRCWIMIHNIIIASRPNIKNPESNNIQEDLKLPETVFITVLSEDSAHSDWLIKHARDTIEEESRNEKTKLYAVCTDSFVKETNIEWVKNIREARHITDFINWEDSETYKSAFNRLFRDIFQTSPPQASLLKQPIPLQTGKNKEGSSGADEKSGEGSVDLVKYLSRFPVFETLGGHGIRDLVTLLRRKSYAAGDIIIRKGEPGRNLFIIVSGKVEVVADGDVTISIMGQGEVFGDMSLLTGNPVVATIRVLEPATVLKLSKESFEGLLMKYPSFQMYFTRLLAERLSRTDHDRARELSSAMVGQLSEMPPSELLQTLHINQKTGVVALELSKGKASICFREGELVGAEYDGLSGEKAFFEIVAENQGRFSFTPGLPGDVMEAPEIGSFMSLLMEATRRMDEED